ncbi:MAG: carboxypeptidase-like regulatory domain-containing protein, partial [Acidobacteria bacterium]|nr:carboxypeptidase-like regulatory domain-containing protein [Acidobacteriota bacterium]
MGPVAGEKPAPPGRRPRVGWLLVLALACLHAPEAAAQAGATTGVIRGEVSDPLGNPVPGAVILIQHRGTDLVTTVETSDSGGFVRSLLPPGTYDLTVTAAGGFGTERIEGAILRVGEVLHFHLDLRIVATETVTVFGELPSPVEATDFTRSQRLREEVVDAVPS